MLSLDERENIQLYMKMGAIHMKSTPKLIENTPNFTMVFPCKSNVFNELTSRKETPPLLCLNRPPKGQAEGIFD